MKPTSKTQVPSPFDFPFTRSPERIQTNKEIVDQATKKAPPKPEVTRPQ
jgi:hypothetical protein